MRRIVLGILIAVLVPVTVIAGMQQDLLEAARKGDRAAVEALLNKGADVNGADEIGRTALREAVSNRQREIVALLLEQGADVNKGDSVGKTALFGAAQSGDRAIMKLLLDKGGDVNARDAFGIDPLITASSFGKTEMISLLLERGADIHTIQKNRYTPLMSAAYKAHAAAVRLLVTRGADINAKDSNFGATALMNVSMEQLSGIVELLIDLGADMNFRSTDGKTALIYAAEYGQYQAVKVLLQKGADASITDKTGSTALDYAKKKHSSIALLLENKMAGQGLEGEKPQAAITSVYDGKYPLLAAVDRGGIEAVKSLVAASADVNGADEKRLTPLMLSAKKGNTDIAKLLLEKGAKIDAQDERGETALMLGSDRGHIEMVRLLLEQGANVYKKDTIGKTALNRLRSTVIVTVSPGNAATQNAGAERLYGEIETLLLERINADAARQGVSLPIQNAFTKAAKSDDVKTMEELLANKARVDGADEDGRVALVRAAAAGKSAAVRFLLKSKANPNVRVDGNYPLQAAVRSDNLEIVTMLLDGKADARSQDEKKSPLLLTAVIRGSLPIARLLLERGADVNQADAQGTTPLHQAAVKGEIDMVIMLLDKKPRVDARETVHGSTPFMSAIRRGRIDLAQLFLDRGADINAADNGGFTSLIATAHDGNLPAVAFLIKHGARLDLRTKEGATALTWARFMKKEDVVQALVRAGAGNPTE